MAREHARAFGGVPGAVLSGIHSLVRRDAEQLAREHAIEHVCDSVAELHARARADLVVVCVPGPAMEAVALQCLEWPWALLLEEPPGLDLSQAQHIRAAAVAAGRRVRVAFNRQFQGSTRRALAALAALPGQRVVHVQDQQDLGHARALGFPPEVRRRWMYANSIHLFDCFRLFARGSVTNVEPLVAWNPRAPAAVVARIDFTSGDVGLYDALWHAPRTWAVSVAVPECRLELRPLEALTVQRFGQGEQRFPPDRRDLEYKPGLRVQAEQAVALARGQESELPDLDAALATMGLIQAVYPVQAELVGEP